MKRQYDWLEQDLARVDRRATPWVVVYGHRPMYCTNDDRDDCTKFETRTRTGLPLLKLWGLEVGAEILPCIYPLSAGCAGQARGGPGRVGARAQLRAAAARAGAARGARAPP